MKITLDTSDDKELRGQVRVLINEHLLSIAREELRTMIREAASRACTPEMMHTFVQEFNIPEIIRQEARAAVTARLEQVFK